MKHGADVKPVLKWAGGKRQLLEPILSFVERAFPDRIDKYYEPFAGGAAVFFALVAKAKFRRARLSDMNADLIGVYRALRDDLHSVISELEKLRELGHSEDAYYQVRARRPIKQSTRAARLIYLNRTGYNGLYRVNRSGEFNVPFGRYAKPQILDSSRLQAAAQALQGVELEVEDFERSCRRAKTGDFVYFDPPYLPLSKTANFAAYHAAPFTLTEHERLAKTFARLTQRGVPTLLSNSDTAETRSLYQAFETRTVHAARAINSKASARGKISEILVHSAPAVRPQRRKKA